MVFRTTAPEAPDVAVYPSFSPPPDRRGPARQLSATSLAWLLAMPPGDSSRKARARLAMLEWRVVHGHDVSRTARHFGWSRPPSIAGSPDTMAAPRVSRITPVDRGVVVVRAGRSSSSSRCARCGSAIRAGKAKLAVPLRR